MRKNNECGAAAGQNLSRAGSVTNRDILVSADLLKCSGASIKSTASTKVFIVAGGQRNLRQCSSLQNITVHTVVVFKTGPYRTRTEGVIKTVLLRTVQ